MKSKIHKNASVMHELRLVMVAVVLICMLTRSETMSKMAKESSLPQTVIAVVGDTGSGKSSLLNSLLEHGNILPTSGMRACTAVVVRISSNESSDSYDADVEFLAEKEWMDELELLLKELTGRDISVTITKVIAVCFMRLAQAVGAIQKLNKIFKKLWQAE